MEDSEAPRLAEIGRRITEVGQNLSDFRSEVRGSFIEMVRKDTYQAERDALRERIASLEQRARNVAALSSGAWVSIAVAVLTLWVTRGQ